MSKLTESQIEILPNHYSRRYKATYVWGDLYEMLERYGEKKKKTFKNICKHRWTIFKNYYNKLICKMDLKKNNLLYEEINKNLYIRILKGKKIAARLNSTYDDKIVVKFIVYRCLF